MKERAKPLTAIGANKANFYRKYIIDHQFRVADICSQIAGNLGMNREEKYFLAQEAVLHDIGKFFVPEDLLMKQGPLEEEEFEKLKDHARLGAEYLESKHFTENIIRAVRNHHERYDGQGYPDGLKGEKIPINSRIIAVADAYDAMVFGRNYKSPMSGKRALKELEMNACKQFDPKIVRVFKSLLRESEVLKCSR